MEQRSKANMYLLMDSRNAPLASGTLESPPDAPYMQIRVLDDKISDVMEHEEIQLIPMASSGPALLGRITRGRNNILTLEKLQALDNDMRQNLRVLTDFHSFIYPISGRWIGRREIVCHDLSCGGIAFYCPDPLELDEQLELVIPITEEPVLMRCKILRRRATEDGDERTLYAAKFVDMCYDEETYVREAVFTTQLQARPKSAAP